MRTPSSLPLLFSFAQVVSGSGFIAAVAMSGRALLEKEDGEEWITGVAPVGLAAGGLDRAEAFQEFRRTWSEVLFDIAAESHSYEDFYGRCSAFLESRVDSLSSDWDESLAHVRESNYEDKDLASKPADSQEVCWEIGQLIPEDVGPEMNRADTGLQAAA